MASHKPTHISHNMLYRRGACADQRALFRKWLKEEWGGAKRVEITQENIMTEKSLLDNDDADECDEEGEAC